MKLHQLDRRRERRWRDGETHSTPIGTSRDGGDLGRHLGGGQNAAVAGLRALD